MLFSVKIFAVSLLFAASLGAGSFASAALESAGCHDSGGSTENENPECYKLITTPKTLTGAVDYCTAQSMHLAFMTEKNAKTINDLVRDHFVSAEQPECYKRITMLANHDGVRAQRYGTYAFTMGTGCMSPATAAATTDSDSGGNSSRSYSYEVCQKEFDCSLVDWNAPSPFVCANNDDEWSVTKYEQDEQFEYYVTENAVKSPVMEFFYPPKCTPFEYGDNVGQVLENVRKFKKFDKNSNFAILSSFILPTTGAFKFCFPHDAQCDADTATAKDKTFGLCRVEKQAAETAADSGSSSRLVQLWPSGIVPYQLSGWQNAPKNASYIRDIMQHISDASGACVKFQEHTTGTTTAASNSSSSSSSKRDLVMIIPNKSKNSCSIEATGRKSGTQVVLFGSECFNDKKPGLILRPLLHTLGIPAEHTRFDRDQYVAINASNVVQEQQFTRQLEKQPIPGKLSLHTQYDFGSVTHFPANALAKGRSLITIKVLKRGADDAAPSSAAVVVGQRAALSEGDKAKLRLLYGDSKQQNCAAAA